MVVGLGYRKYKSREPYRGRVFSKHCVVAGGGRSVGQPCLHWAHPSARWSIHVHFTVALLQVLWPLASSFPDPKESHLLVNWWADYEMSPTDATGLRDPIFCVSRVLMKQDPIREWQMVSSTRGYYPWVLVVSGIVFSWNVNHCHGSCVMSRMSPTAVTSVTDDRSTLSDPNLNKRSITSSQLLKCTNNTTPTRSYF